MKACVLVCVLIFVPLSAAAQEESPPAEPAAGAETMAMTAAADVSWMPFNPEEPEGIRMAAISGDPAVGPFRALVRFPAGFDSGLHTHTSDYTAVSLSGMRQRGPNAEALTDLGPGSYWIQPAGEPHVDLCVGDDECMIFIEVRGPIDMIPAETPADGEPGMTMVAADSVPWGPMMADMPDGPQIAIVSGDMATGPVAVLMRFPPGHDSGVHIHTAPYTAVVLTGTPQHGPNAEGLVDLGPGSYWIQPGGEPHLDRCSGEEACTMFVQLDGAFDMTPVEGD